MKIPLDQLRPFLSALMPLAEGVGKGNPLVGTALSVAKRLIGEHGGTLPPDIVQTKQRISASLASDFAAMDAAFDRAQKAGQYKPPGS